MKAMLHLGKLQISILFLLLFSLVIYAARLEALLWYSIKPGFSAVSPHTSLELGRYTVTIDALPISGVDSDLSGLTYNHETGTLFSVINGQSSIVELSASGDLIRKIALQGVKDVEGITHIRGHHYAIVDEAEHRLMLIEIRPDSLSVDITDVPQLKLDLNIRRNKSFEGVSWDEHHQRLLVVTERNPLRVLQITGFVEQANGKDQLSVTEVTPGRFNRLALRDLSSVTHGPHGDTMLLLSHESRLLAEYDADGKLLGSLNLWRGFHGLSANIPQAEGVAIDADSRIYITSEPNLFYVFEKATAMH
ncbi:MAG: SdiA-regulated domain-containing protein [Methylophaga sp.]|nr:SdiA-regulated domain-containing protein [Methylophaga sp.]